MRRIELRTYNGQWQDRGVVERIHRRLKHSAAMGECILVDGEHVKDLPEELIQFIFEGLPWQKIRPVGFPSLCPFPPPAAPSAT